MVYITLPQCLIFKSSYIQAFALTSACICLYLFYALYYPLLRFYTNINFATLTFWTSHCLKIKEHLKFKWSIFKHLHLHMWCGNPEPLKIYSYTSIIFALLAFDSCASSKLWTSTLCCYVVHVVCRCGCGAYIFISNQHKKCSNEGVLSDCRLEAVQYYQRFKFY